MSFGMQVGTQNTIKIDLKRHQKKGYQKVSILDPIYGRLERFQDGPGVEGAKAGCGFQVP